MVVGSWRSVCLQLVSAVIIIYCNQLYLGRSWISSLLSSKSPDQIWRHSLYSDHMERWSHEIIPCIIAIIEFCQYWILIAIKVTGFPQFYAVHAFQMERCEKLQMPNWKQHQSSRKFWNLPSVNDPNYHNLANSSTLPPQINLNPERMILFFTMLEKHTKFSFDFSFSRIKSNWKLQYNTLIAFLSQYKL